MAEQQHDGAIIVDTGIDTDGFESGSKELLEAIKSLCTEIKSLGEIIKNAFNGSTGAVDASTSAVEKNKAALQKTKQEAEALSDKMDELSDKSNEAGDSLDMDAPVDKVAAFRENLDHTIDDINDLSKSLQSIEAQGDTSWSQDEFNAASEQMERLKTRISDLSNELSAMNEQDYKMLLGEFAAVRSGVDDIGKSYERVAAARERFENAQGSAAPVEPSPIVADTPTSDAPASVPEQTVTVDTQEAQKAVSDLDDKVEDLKDSVVELKTEGNSGELFDTKASAAEAAKLSKGFESVTESLDKLGPLAETALGGSEKAASSLNSKLDTVSYTIDKLDEKMAQMGQTQFKTDDYTDLCSQIEKAEKALFKLYERQDKMTALGVNTDSQSWKSLQYDIKTTEEMLSRFETHKAQMESSGSAYVAGSDTAGYQSLQAALDSVIAKYNALVDAKDRAFAMHTSGGLIGALRNAAPLSTQLANGFTAIRAKAAQVGPAIRSGLGAALNAVTHPIQTANAGLGKLTVAVGHLGKKALSSLGGVAKKVFAGLGNAAKAAGSKILQLSKSFGHAKKSSSRFGKGLKGLVFLLKQMLMFRVFSMIFEGLKTGMNNLAQYSSKVNKDLSTLKSSLTQLKNSFATAFAPILSVVTPILAKLISYLARAVTMVGKFIAALTGAKTFTQAKAVQEDYAASLDKTGAAAEEAKNQLAGFDELNVLSDNSSAGGGGDGTVDPSEMFEEVPIDSPILNFAEKLKEAFKNGDYEGVGRMLGEKLNEVIAKVDQWISWDNVGGTITKIVTAFADIVNSLFATIDWTALGNMVAEGVNTVVNTLYLIFTEIDWALIGKSIADGLDGAIDGINWKKLGNTIGEYFNTFLHLALGFITNFDWGEAGTALADGLSGIVDSVDWKGIGKILSDGMIGALEFIRKAISGFKWSGLGKNVASGINQIDWSGAFSSAAGAISDAVSGVLDLIIGFVEELDWGQVGTELWDSLVGIIKNIDWSDLVSKAFRLLGGVIGGSGSLFVSLCKSIWESLKSGWNSTKSYFDKFIDDAGGNIIKGLWNGIVNAIKNVGKWIKENIFQPFIDGFKKAFGIHSPSTVMEEQGGFLIEGLLNGITAGWKSITTFFSNALASLGQLLANGWETLKQGAITAWDGISGAVTDAWNWIDTNVSKAASAVGQTVSTGWNNIKTWTSEKWSNIKTTVADTWSNLKTTVSDAATKVGTFVSDNWNKVKTWTSEKWSAVKTTVGDAWTNIKEKTSTIGSQVKESVSSAWSNVKEKISTKLNEAKSSAATAWDNIKSKATTIGSNIKDSVSSAWSNVKEKISTKLTEAKNSASSTWDSIKTKASTTGSNIKSAVSGAWDSVKSYVTSKLTSAKTSAATTWDSIKSKATSTGSNIKSAVSGAWDSVKSYVTSKLSSAKSSASSTWDSIKSKATSTGSSIKSAVSGAWDNVKSYITSKLNSAKSSASSAWSSMKSTATSQNNGIKSSLSSVWTSIKTTLNSRMSGISSSMSSTFSNLKSNASTWGRHICENLSNGMDNFNYKVKNAAKRLAQKIKDFIGFSEPDEGPLSNFHTYMPDMVDLLVKGMEDNKKRAGVAASHIAQAISNEVQKDYATGNVVPTGQIDSALNGFSDKITNGFTDLLDRLQAIADGVTFTTPAMASRVVPYSVSAKSSGSDEQLSNTIVNSNDQLAALIARVTANMTSAIVAAIKSSGTGGSNGSDIQTATTAVINEINRRTRMNGTSPLLG